MVAAQIRAADEVSTLHFVGSSDDSAPLTWGQRALWIALRRHGSGQTMISIRRVLTMPRRAQADVATVVGALAALINRHSSLRTRLRIVDSQLRQVVGAAGELPVLLVHADEPTSVARVAEATARRLAEIPFDHAAEWPQRLALVLVDEQVHRLVVVFSHTTVDFQAAEIVLRDLRMLLLGKVLAVDAGLQSVDIARREDSEHHRRRGQRSVIEWVAHFGRLPAETLPSVGPGLVPRFQRAVLTSVAADTAVRLIATRHRVTSSTVLLSATAAVLGAWTGNSVIGVFTMSNNRSLDGYRDAIAKLNQLGLVVVDLSDEPTFGDLLPRVWQAALEAYRHAYYDPTLMADAFATAGYPYATGVSPHCYLNDIRLSTDIDLFGRDVGEGDVRAALSSSTVVWSEGFDRFTWRTRVEILDRPGALGLALTADTCHLTPEAMERFLRDVERLLVDAAFAAAGGASRRAPASEERTECAAASDSSADGGEWR